MKLWKIMAVLCLSVPLAAQVQLGRNVKIGQGSSGTTFEQQVIPPIDGQYVVVYPTVGTITADPTGTSIIGPQGGRFKWLCSNGIGLCTIAPHTTGSWTGFSLPSYVNPANVTAVYAFAVASADALDGALPSGGANTSRLACSTMGPTDTLFPSFSTPTIPWGGQQNNSLTTIAGSAVSSTTCTIDLGNSTALSSGIDTNIPAIGLIVYYTGDPPPVRTAIDVVPPLAYNPSALTLSDDAVQVDSINGVPGAFTFTGSGVSCTTTTCTFSGGGGSVSGQANGVIPLATASTTIGAQSHLDDGISTAATITSSEPIAVAGSTHGVSIPAGPAVAGAAGKVIYASDATSGFAEVNENNTGLSRVCTAFNYGSICPSAGSSPLTTKGDLYTFSTANARLGVGADGLVLSADSTQATGLKWIAATGTGNTTSTALTTNFFPKANGANSIINSLVSESGGAFNVPEPVAVSDGTGNGGIFDATEGTAPSATATHDILYADSTSHCMKYSANGGAFACIGGSGIPTSPSNALVKINGSGGAASSLSDSGTALSAPEPLTLTTTGNVPLTLTSSSTSNTAFILSNSNVTGEWIFEEQGAASPAGMFFFNFFNATDHIPVGWDKTTLNTMLNGSSVLGWTSGSPISTSLDTGISRDSAGVVDIGNGTAGNASGSIKATNLTLTGTCTGCGAGGSGAWTNITGAVTVSGCTVSGSQCVVGTATANVTLSAIAGTYTSIVIVGTFNTSDAGANDLHAQFNADTGLHYVWQNIFAGGASPGSGGAGALVASAEVSAIAGTGSGSNPNGFRLLIPNYANTTFNKTTVAESTRWASSTQQLVVNYDSRWESTAAITSVKLFSGSGGNIVTGSTFSIYGVQ